MIRNVSVLFNYRDLIRIWSMRQIKARYKQSFLGAGWAILQPLVMMLMFTFVFSIIADLPSDGIPYPIFSYTALLPWTFLTNSITTGTSSLLTNIGLVTKIYFPREVLPFGAVAAAFIDFLIASVVFVALMLYYRIPIYGTVLWVPVLLLIQIVLTFGVVFFGSALMVWYRDIRYVIPLGLQIWMYASPIIYPVSLVPEQLQPLYMLNPMACLIDSYRRVILLGQPPQFVYLLWAAIFSLLLCIAGYAYFKRSEVQFADVI